MDRLRRLAEPSPVLFRCLFASQAAMLVLSPILPEVARDFGVSTATAAVLAGAQAVLGVGVGLLVAVGIAAAGEWPRPARRPHVLAWAIAGMPAAWIVGMPAVGAVASVHRRATWIAVPTLVALVA